jgi:putative membrane protein insertion efficiency factor
MKLLLIGTLRFYQRFISPVVSTGSCRFYPSCSQYSIDAIGKYGIVKGIIRSVGRIARCNPYHPGGVDPA